MASLWARPVSLSFALLAALPAPVLAQDACFDGAPRPSCSSFFIGELAASLPIVSSTGVAPYSKAALGRPLFDKQLEWQIGLMYNVSDRWAIGGAMGLGSGSTTPVTSLTGRARRWLSPSIGLDMSAGAILRSSSDGGAYDARGASLTGGRADVRLNFNDDVYFGIRSERLTIDPRDQPAFGDYDAGTHQATSLHFGLGTEWALAGTAFVAAWMVAWLVALYS